MVGALPDFRQPIRHLCCAYTIPPIPASTQPLIHPDFMNITPDATQFQIALFQSSIHKIWKSTSASIRNSPSLDIFKKSLSHFDSFYCLNTNCLFFSSFSGSLYMFLALFASCKSALPNIICIYVCYQFL